MNQGIPRIQFATTEDGFRIAHSVSGSGPPLIFCPGWVGHLEYQWQGASGRFCQRLAESFTLICYDGRGTGLSDREAPDLSVGARVRDLEAVIAHNDLDTFSLFGWSQGSPMTIKYAADNAGRVERIVLYAAFCDYVGEDDALGLALVNLIRAEWGVGARTTMGFVHPDADQDEINQSLAFFRASSSGDVAARILEDGFFHANVCGEVPRVTAPTLVLHRREDTAVRLELGRRVASLLPNGRLVVLDGHNHLPFHGDVESVVRNIEEFFGFPAGGPPLVAPEHPAPTEQSSAPVTILLTDMAGSTNLTDMLGDSAAQEFVRTHNTIVRNALSAHGGSEVKHTGDGIMASFPSASRAVECAVAIQRALARHNYTQPDAALEVRIGLNAGEPVREEDDLFGQTVQAAARITARARPGQILVSEVVRTLAAGKGFEFIDRGRAALKGLRERVRLHEVAWAE